MKTKFTIGETAKMCSISADTLRYYNRIGLISPKHIGENGYRYYDYEDFLFLYAIKYMKKIGMPLADMKKHFENRTKESTRENFYKQLKQIEKEIEELQGVRSQILRNIKYFERVDTLEPNDMIPYLEIIEDRYALLSCDEKFGAGTPLQDGTRYEMLMCDVMEELCKENYWTMGPSISMKSMDDLKSGNFHRTYAAGNMLASQSKSEKARIVPGGIYACIYHKSSCDIGNSYKKLMKYITDNNYEIAGDAYEIFMVDTVDTKEKDELITHIQIPIIK